MRNLVMKRRKQIKWKKIKKNEEVKRTGLHIGILTSCQGNLHYLYTYCALFFVRGKYNATTTIKTNINYPSLNVSKHIFLLSNSNSYILSSKKFFCLKEIECYLIPYQE